MADGCRVTRRACRSPEFHLPQLTHMTWPPCTAWRKGGMHWSIAGGGVGLRWDHALFPSLRFWQVYQECVGYPWHGMNCVIAMEPVTSYPPTLTEAIKAGTQVLCLLGKDCVPACWPWPPKITNQPSRSALVNFWGSRSHCRFPGA